MHCDDECCPRELYESLNIHQTLQGEMLYVNPNFGRYVEVGGGSDTPMEEGTSDALLQHLYSQANFPEYQCYFRYEEGSMAFWDNRACMHRATVDFSGHERAMRRVTVQGSDPPFWRPQSAPSGAAKL